MLGVGFFCSVFSFCLCCHCGWFGPLVGVFVRDLGCLLFVFFGRFSVVFAWLGFVVCLVCVFFFLGFFCFFFGVAWWSCCFLGVLFCFFLFGVLFMVLVFCVFLVFIDAVLCFLFVFLVFFCFWVLCLLYWY